MLVGKKQHRIWALLFVFVMSCYPFGAMALEGGQYEKPYTDISVLSAQEREFFEQEIKAGRLREDLGSISIVYPDSHLPLVGVLAEQAFVKGDVSIMAFSGLPNSFLGSMTVAKQVAQVNGLPVLAVHTGYGDAGVFEQGPSVFFSERLMNRLGVAKSDPALTSALKLLKARDLGAETVTLVGYCLGALKVGNLTLHLEKERPEIFKKLRVLSLGLAVFHSQKLQEKRQLIGNLDSFGRINSTNEWDAIVVPSSAHSIRTDRAAHLEIPSIETVFMNDNVWLPIAPDFGKSSELASLKEEWRRQLQQVEAMLGEVVSVSSNGYTDQMHDHKLAHKQSYLSYLIAQADLEILHREGRGDADPLVREAKLALQAAEKEMKEHQSDYDYVSRIKRSGTSDLYEYQAWKQKRAANPDMPL